MGLMGFVSKLSSVICHESGHNISLSCNNMPLCGNNMALLNDYGWLLFTQKVHKRLQSHTSHLQVEEPSLLCTF